MRPAYETYIAAIKKDLNRVTDHMWDRVYQQLMECGTKEERKYLKSEMNKLHYEYTETVLGGLVLGIKEGSKEETMLYRMGMGRRLSHSVYEDSYPIKDLSVPENPDQMELPL